MSDVVLVNGVFHPLGHNIRNYKGHHLENYINTHAFTTGMVRNMIFDKDLDPKIIKILTKKGFTPNLILDHSLISDFDENTSFENLEKWGITSDLMIRFIAQNGVKYDPKHSFLKRLLIQNIGYENREVLGNFIRKAFNLYNIPTLLFLKEIFSLEEILKLIPDLVSHLMFEKSKGSIFFAYLSIFKEWGLPLTYFSDNNYTHFLYVCRINSIKSIRFLFDWGLVIVQDPNEPNLFKDSMRFMRSQTINLLTDQGIDLFHNSNIESSMEKITKILQELPEPVSPDLCPENAQCGFCRDHFLLNNPTKTGVIGTMLSLFQCRHMFHTVCVEKLDNCPVCDAKIQYINIQNIKDDCSIEDAREILVSTNSYSLNL